MSTLALAPDTFTIERCPDSSDFSICRSEPANADRGCLVFSECHGATLVCDDETTGTVLCAHPAFSDNSEALVFAAVLRPDEQVVFEGGNLEREAYHFDGDNLWITRTVH